MAETWIPRSSNLDQVTYDADSKTLTIAFRQGNVYEYRGVPNEVYLALQHAPSPGSYFFRNIRSRYNSSEV